jgi:hypothetical protein
MSLKARLETRLKASRDYSEGLLSGFKTPEQWVHQVHPKVNHALWFAGHMGVSDDFFLSVLAPEKAKDDPSFSKHFGMGSQPVNDPAAYPPVEEVLGFMRDRRGALLSHLTGLTDADLALPTPKGSPDFLPDVASVFEMAIWHEGLHSGQVSVAHRALGHAPMF